MFDTAEEKTNRDEERVAKKINNSCTLKHLLCIVVISIHAFRRRYFFKKCDHFHNSLNTSIKIRKMCIIYYL